MINDIFHCMDIERANAIYDQLRAAGYSKNRAKILAFLEQTDVATMSDITLLLGISSSRANATLKYLISEGLVQRMERKETRTVGRSFHVYRLKMPINDIVLRMQNRLTVYITDDYKIEP